MPRGQWSTTPSGTYQQSALHHSMARSVARKPQIGNSDIHMQDMIKTACSPDQAGTGLQPRLREAIVLMLAAAPQGSELVRDVVVAMQHGLEVACSASFLPDLVLRLLQLPDVSQVSLRTTRSAAVCFASASCNQPDLTVMQWMYF